MTADISILPPGIFPMTFLTISKKNVPSCFFHIENPSCFPIENPYCFFISKKQQETRSLGNFFFQKGVLHIILITILYQKNVPYKEPPITFGTIVLNDVSTT